MIQLLCASTLFGAATLVAAIDAAVLPAADRRILLVQNNVTDPELAPSLETGLAFEAIQDRFDEIIHYNDVIHPYHPKEWKPRTEDLALWQRQLRSHWGLGSEPVELVAESISTAPSSTMIRIFESSPVIAYADGLMSYGPTRDTLPYEVGGRVHTLLHLDLVPGLRPVLLSEWDVPAVVVPTDSFRQVIKSMLSLDAPERHGFTLPSPRSYALLLGQYLSAINLLSAEQEFGLHQTMVRQAVARGYRRIVMKAHPSAPADDQRPLREYARKLGVDLEYAPAALLAESLLVASPPGLVVGCFSTGLVTAAGVFDCEITSVGTMDVLERLRPYWNSNRVPIIIIDALTRPDSPYRDLRSLQELVDTVSFCMQPKRLAHLRPRAEDVLSQFSDAELRRYPKRRRLTHLGLPGSLQEVPQKPRKQSDLRPLVVPATAPVPLTSSKPYGMRRIALGVRRRVRRAVQQGKR